MLFSASIDATLKFNQSTIWVLEETPQS